MWERYKRSSILLFGILGLSLGCNHDDKGGEEVSRGFTLTLQAEVTPTPITTPQLSLESQQQGTISCHFDCEITLTRTEDEKVIFATTIPQDLLCNANSGILIPQSLTLLQTELGPEFHCKSIQVGVTCTDEAVDYLDPGSFLFSIFIGSASLVQCEEPQSEVSVSLLNLLDSLSGGKDPERIFCDLYEALDFLLLLFCPESPQEIVPEGVSPNSSCGNFTVDPGEACDGDGENCPLPLGYECLPPGDPAECTCRFNLCSLLPLLNGIVNECSAPPPVCGDGMCEGEEFETCLEDCHCGDGIVQHGLEQCDPGVEGSCPGDQECGYQGFPMQCQCVKKVICDAEGGQIRCPPGSGVDHCVTPCDGADDGTDDCTPDGFDETSDFCGSSCEPGTIWCFYDDRCVKPCDGLPECGSEGEDESFFLCGK